MDDYNYNSRANFVPWPARVSVGSWNGWFTIFTSGTGREWSGMGRMVEGIVWPSETNGHNVDEQSNTAIAY